MAGSAKSGIVPPVLSFNAFAEIATIAPLNPLSIDGFATFLIIEKD